MIVINRFMFTQHNSGIEILIVKSKINEDLILAGCSGLHEVKLFDMKRDCAPCGSIINMDKGIYSVDFANTENNFAFGGGEGISRVIQIDN